MDTFWKKKPDKKGIPSGGKQKTKDHPVKKWLETSKKDGRAAVLCRDCGSRLEGVESLRWEWDHDTLFRKIVGGRGAPLNIHL